MSARFCPARASLACALAMAAMFALLPAQATTYFVATNGSDANLGTTVGAPFLTIQHATGKLTPGDFCVIRGGTYHETITPATSGKSGAPITFTCYSNETVTIDAADPLTGWTAVSNGIYQAHAPFDMGTGFNEIFVDGAMIQEAQTPNYGTGDVMHPGFASVFINPNTPNVVTSTTFSGKPDNYWAGAWFIGGVAETAAWQTAHVISSTGDSITLDPTTETGAWWFIGNGTGHLWGLYSMLDSDNEWYLQTNTTGNTLYLRITGGADPTTHVVERKKHIWTVNYNGQNNIKVSGLNLWAGAVNLTGNSNLLESCNAQYLSHYMVITAGYLENGGLQQGGGVVVNGIQNEVRNCVIGNTAGSGVFTTGVSNIVTRNTIYNTDYSGTYAAAITLRGSADVVTFNTAFATGRDILRPEGIGSDIEFNDLSNPGLLDKDLGVIYSWGIIGLGVNNTPTRIAHNWIHDNNHPTPAPLVYLDNWDAFYEVDHNVIWNSGGDAGVRINPPDVGDKIYNNTIFNCAPVGANSLDTWGRDNPNPSFWTNDIDQYSSSNNLYFSGSPAAQLVNWSFRDFRLKTNAPAIDAGVAIPGMTDNYLGAAPDLGAYEFGALPWTAGVGSRLSLVVTNSGANVKLMASPDAAFYQLYAATNLTPPVAWSLVTNTPVVSPTLWSMTLPGTGNAPNYYRLQSQ